MRLLTILSISDHANYKGIGQDWVIMLEYPVLSILCTVLRWVMKWCFHLIPLLHKAHL